MLQINVCIVHRGNQLHIAFCTSYCDIQSSLTADTVQWSEVAQQAALCINAIGNAENDGISLVTLYCFKIFDKEWLVSIILEEKLLFRCALPPLRKQLINQILLGDTKCDHAKTAAWILLDILINQINDKLCFLSVGMCFAIKNTVYMIIIHTNPRHIDLRRWECHKIVVVEIFVGKCNQLFITAAVMPTQLKLLHRC